MNIAREQLKNKVLAAYQKRLEDWRGMTVDELIEDCEAVYITDKLSRLLPACASEEDAEYLHRFVDPLEVVVDAWIASNGLDAIYDILSIDDIAFWKGLKRAHADLDDPTANSGSANFTKYARDIDEKWPRWYNGKKNGYAWCDVYCDWCFLTAFGYERALALTCQPERSAGAGCTFSLGYYKAKGQFHTSGPKAGDQIFFGTSLSNATHTGIVEKVGGGKVYTVEGNTSDQVARRSYSLTDSSILGYGRPAYDAEETGADTSVPASKYYRVRKSWADKASQIGAYTVFKNAVNAVDANPGYAAFDDNGNQVYPKAETTFKPYLVKITVSDLNYRKGPSTGYASWGYITPGIYTIVDEQDGWGLLKAYADKRNGWICLDYAKKL